MPVITTKYYAKTVVLKTAAVICFFLEKLRLLDGYKRSNDRYFTQLFEKNFEDSIVEKNATFSQLYLTYSHFAHPDDLGRHLRFDEEGVVMCRTDIAQPYYNPFFAAYYALNCYNHYALTKDAGSLESYWVQVRHLEKTGVEKDGCMWFQYHYNHKKLALTAPWVSGLTQVAVMSVFLRAVHFEGVEKYGVLVEKLYRSLFVPIGEGGVFRLLENGDPWIEEYPSQAPDLTLNGFIFCLVGLYEYYHWKGKPETIAGQLRPLIKTLFYRLHEFVFWKYTRYHRRSWVFHNIEYAGVYVGLFLHLHLLSGKEVFRELARRYDKHTSWQAFYEFYALPDRSGELVKIYFDE